MTYHAVLFDLDGTLTDTLDDLADAANWTLAQFGLPTHPTDAYRRMVGDGIYQLARRAVPPGRDDLVEKIVPAMRDRYQTHMFDKTRPYPGVAELLDALTARDLPMAVLTNKPHAAAVEVVARLLGRWRFAAVRGMLADRVLKPDPAGAIAIADQLNIPPGQWLYVGDTNTDMATAGNAGMFAVGVLWGFREAAELTAAGAAALIAHPLELLELLDSQQP